MTRALTLLAELRDDIRQPLTDELASAIWNKVLFVERELEDSRHWKVEEPLVRRLRETVSAIFAAHNEGAATLPIGLASVAITALESTVQRNTTGLDGWPLRQ